MTLRTVPAAACLILACGTLHSANLGFLGNAPISRMSAEDVDLLYTAVTNALDRGEDGTATRWGNPSTGASGTLVPLDTFTGPGGQRCRHLQVDNQAGGLHNKSVFELCKQADGTWKAIAN
jgi:surface antigen